MHIHEVDTSHRREVDRFIHIPFALASAALNTLTSGL